jgi:(5-formylfuran-3-yl)methyl phosphate synthase
MTATRYGSPGVGLLVSVRDRVEAQVALAAGASWIDVKEPAAGPLGAASPEVIAEVLQTVGCATPASAALGELVDWDANGFEIPRPVSGPLVVKLGLAGCGSIRNWRGQWRAAAERLPDFARLVAVIYADWRAADAPPPEEIFAAAGEVGCRAVLVDTFQKNGRGLLDHWSAATIAELCEKVRRCGRLMVLAGSLSIKTAPIAARLGPDYIAVRGAVCTAGRQSTLCPERIAVLLQALDGAQIATSKSVEDWVEWQDRTMVEKKPARSFQHE